MQNFNYHQHTFRCGHADMDMQDEDYVKEYIKNKNELVNGIIFNVKTKKNIEKN